MNLYSIATSNLASALPAPRVSRDGRALGLLCGSALLAAVSIAPARAAVPPPVRGTITAISGDTLTLKRRFGGGLMLHLSPDTGYVGATKSSLAEVKPGRFIGTAAVPGPHGTLQASEITIFPESMRGAGEGHYGWNLGKSSTMTNGTIGTVAAADKFSMTVDYKGGHQKLVVPDDVPVVNIEPGSRDMVKVGAHVVAFGAKGSGGAMEAKRVIVGEGGTVPPM